MDSECKQMLKLSIRRFAEDRYRHADDMNFAYSRYLRKALGYLCSKGNRVGLSGQDILEEAHDLACKWAMYSGMRKAPYPQALYRLLLLTKTENEWWKSEEMKMLEAGKFDINNVKWEDYNPFD